MITATMHEAKTNLSKLVAAVERGERVRLVRGRQPVAELVPFHKGKAVRRNLFAAHPWRGRVSGAFFADPTATMSADEWPEDCR